MEADGLTVVIATRNRAAELCRTLDRLIALPEQPAIIVVDNHSSDGTPAMLRSRYPTVGVVAMPANLGAAARTVGARLATSPLVAFADDDSWWDPGALREAATVLAADPAVGLVAGQVRVGSDAAVDPTSALMAAGRFDEWFQSSPVGRRGVTGFMACAAVIRRTAFLAAGGFDAHLFIGGEEELVTLDLADGGWKLVYVPSAIARHHPSLQRQSGQRRRMLVRNHLLTACLRYSVSTTARRWTQPLGSLRRPSTWAGAGTAVWSLSWAMSRRRLVAPRLEGVFTTTGGMALPEQ